MNTLTEELAPILKKYGKILVHELNGDIRIKEESFDFEDVKRELSGNKIVSIDVSFHTTLGQSPYKRIIIEAKEGK